MARSREMLELVGTSGYSFETLSLALPVIHIAARVRAASDGVDDAAKTTVIYFITHSDLGPSVVDYSAGFRYRSSTRTYIIGVG